MADRWYQRYAWVLIFAPGLLLFVSPVISGYFTGSPDSFVIWTVTGMNLDQIRALSPRLVGFLLRAYQDLGLAWFGFGLLVMALAAFPFRKGERFGWYALWVFPAYWAAGALSFTVQIANEQLGTNGLAQLSVVGTLVVLVIVLLGLLLPYRKFFPARHTAESAGPKESFASSR